MQMNETQDLRRYLGSRLAVEALRIARRRRFADALSVADRASRVDPTLPHPHVIASKSLFWLGDTDGAELRLRLARQLGYDAVAASAMQREIDRVRELSLARFRSRERAIRRRGEFGEALSGLMAAVVARFTSQAVARSIAMLAFALTLIIAWWLRGA
jgi:hypothetical protein